MGTRGEVFSTKVTLDKRTYFFNVKENRMGDLFVSIVESKKSEDSLGYERHSIVLFKDDVQSFLKGFEECLRYLDKEGRAKGRAEPRAKTAPGIGHMADGNGAYTRERRKRDERAPEGRAPREWHPSEAKGDKAHGARADFAKKKAYVNKAKQGEATKVPRSLVRKAVRVRKKEGPSE